jgi:exo-beta-1,3-glucanase (GH17 family)
MNHLLRPLGILGFLVGFLAVPCLVFAGAPDKRFPLFRYLTRRPTPTLIAYAPSELDPRQEANQRKLATSSIRADLKALREAFDGLVLYGYHEACTPRILAVAKDLKYRGVLLGIWDPKSAAEVDGLAALVRQFHNDFALGILVGNEGITFKRYEAEDVQPAAARLKTKIPKTIPVSTSEPLAGSKSAFVLGFGDFLAPNIHPVFDRPQLGPAKAAAWVRQEATRLAEKAKKPVILKETGLPHGGKQSFTPAVQKEFWSAYLKPEVVSWPKGLPGAWVFQGVAFEAFDLSWKAVESRLLIEQYWGLLSKDRRPYPALSVWKALAQKNGPKQH